MTLPILLLLSACARPVAEDGAGPVTAPAILPLDGLLVTVDAPPAADPGPALDARAAALRGRAAELRGPVIGP